MKKKWLARLLSVTVALMLPFGAMAQSAAVDLLKQAKNDGKEIVTTVSFVPGAELAKDQAVSDLFSALALKFQSLGERTGSFAIALSGTDMMTVQLRATDDGFYVNSKELGDQSLFFSLADIQTGIAGMLKNSGMNEASITQFSEAIGGALGEIAMNKGMMTANNNTMMTTEQMKQKMLDAIGADATLTAWVNGIEAKKVVTKGSFTLGDSDTADTKTEITLTAEDINALYDTQFVKDKLLAQLKASDSTTTEQQAEESLTKLKDAITKSGMTIPVTVYTNGENDFVAMEYGMTGTFDNSEITMTTVDSTAVSATDSTAVSATDSATATPAPSVPVKMDIAAQLITKTTDSGKNYSFTMNVKKDDLAMATLTANLMNNLKGKYTGAFTLLGQDAKPMLTLALNADNSDVKNPTGELSGVANDGTKAYAFKLAFTQVVGDSTVDTAISLSTGDSLEAIQAAPDASLQGTLKINTVVQDDSGAFKDISAATPDTSLQVLKMTDAQLGEYVKKLESNYTQLLYNVYANLPQSVAQAVGGVVSQ